jgi:anion-transporting  ArsA/GET3 family ATPase
LFSERKEFPTVNNSELSTITQKLKEINQKFLLPLNIDFGIRSIRQSLNYAELNKSTYDYGDVFDISLNTVILQKIFPRFMFDGSETAKNGETKIKVVEELQKFLADEFNEFYYNYESDETDIGKSSSEYLEEMIKQANRNNSQFNFFA